MTRGPSEHAEAVAVQVLAWLASDPERLGAFLGASGLSVDAVREAASDPGFLGAVLDFVLMEDESVLAAAEAVGLRPERLMALRAQLPGGDQPHWT